MTIDFNLAPDLIEKLDEWANKLAAPLLPPVENPAAERLEFCQHTPHTVMIGKCVRAVSGIHAALALANQGYVTECASIIRMVWDFCTEITAIGEALNRGGEFPKAVHTFVEQYFVPKSRTLEQFEKTELPHYTSREELLKGEVRLAQKADVDGEKMRTVHRYLNSRFDAYVHGAYETTMELYDPRMGRFRMRGHSSPLKRQEHVEAVFLTLPNVVSALQLTAAVTSHQDVYNATRDARRALEQAGWSVAPTCDS